jgi:predicted nucleotidyltransferase
MERVELEKRLREILTSTGSEVVAAYLFGSVARGTEGEGSDVDVAVLLRRGAPRSLADLPLDLESALEGAVGRPVQVVVLSSAPPDLVHRVLRDGRLLLDRDPSFRVRFEVRLRNLFFDLQPVLRRYRRQEATSR